MSHIQPALFTFLRELADNNNRNWFNANKARYETEVREPLLSFIVDFGVRLPEISPHFVADARKSGGSLFRIYRDVRFAKDKAPYKTQAGIQFRHKQGKDVHAPGFYLHLEPDNLFIGLGIWHPNTATLNLIRDAIIQQADQWQAMSQDARLQATFRMEGESLKRAPKGYAPDHPLMTDLRRKDFILVANYNEPSACADDFMDRFTDACKVGAPYVKFITEAVGLEF